MLDKPTGLAYADHMEAQHDPAEPSDAALIAGCRRGDSSAWETLVRRYQRLIYSIPMRAGLGEEAAADVFQHVWAMLFQKLHTLEHPERVGAWLATTARREAWRAGRRARGGGSSRDDETAMAGIADDAPLPDELVERLEAQNSVRVAVDALDERCRELLNLLFFRAEPPPYSDIAARLGVAEGTIGPARARCLERLRRTLARGQSE